MGRQGVPRSSLRWWQQTGACALVMTSKRRRWAAVPAVVGGGAGSGGRRLRSAWMRQASSAGGLCRSRTSTAPAVNAVMASRPWWRRTATGAINDAARISRASPTASVVGTSSRIIAGLRSSMEAQAASLPQRTAAPKARPAWPSLWASVELEVSSTAIEPEVSSEGSSTDTSVGRCGRIGGSGWMRRVVWVCIVVCPCISAWSCCVHNSSPLPAPPGAARHRPSRPNGTEPYARPARTAPCVLPVARAGFTCRPS